MSEPGEQAAAAGTATTPSTQQGSPPQPTVSPIPPQPTVSPIPPQPTVSPIPPQPTVSPTPLQPADPLQPLLLQRKPKQRPTELTLDDSGTPLLEQSDSDKSCSISPSDDREMAISPTQPCDDLPAYTSLPSAETNEPPSADLLEDPQPSTSTGFRGAGFVPHYLLRSQQSSSSDSLSEKAAPPPDISRRFSLPLAAARAPSLPDSSLGSSDYTSMSSIDEASMARRNVRMSASVADSGGGSSCSSVHHTSESDIPMSSPSLEREGKVGSEMTTATSTPSEMLSPAQEKDMAAAVPGIRKPLRKWPPVTDLGEGAEKPEESAVGATSPVPTELHEILDVIMASPVPGGEPADEEETAQEANLESKPSIPAAGAPGDTLEAAEQRTVKAEDTRPSYEHEREERGAREADALKKLKERAATERAQLLSDDAAQAAARQSENRAAEAKFIAERDQPVPKGEEWTRVSQMCDLRQNAPHHEKDASRYRAMLSDLSQGGVQVPSKPEDTAGPERAPEGADAPAGTSSASTSPTPPADS